MNHYAVLIHNLSDLALADKVPEKDKPIGKLQPALSMSENKVVDLH
jgi:hypothetical protein